MRANVGRGAAPPGTSTLARCGGHRAVPWGEYERWIRPTLSTPCSPPTWRRTPKRPASARRAGTAALVVGAGFAKYRFLDDQPDPFVVNPHFKAWAPVLDAPGSFIVYVPEPSRPCCSTSPRTTGTSRRRSRARRGSRRSTSACSATPPRRAARCPPGRSTSASPSAAARSGASPRSTRRRCCSACTGPGRQVAVRARLHAARGGGRRPCPSGGGGGIPSREDRSTRSTWPTSRPPATPRLSFPYPNIIALNEGAAILHYTDLKRTQPPRPALVPDRRGRAIPRLRLRHHAHARRSREPVRRPDRRRRRTRAAPVRHGPPGRAVPRDPSRGTPAGGGTAGRTRHRDLQRRRCGRDRRDERVLPARRRPPARPAGARRRRSPGDHRREATRRRLAATPTCA